jgi:cytochrome P450
VQAALREPPFRQASPKGAKTYEAGAPDHVKLRAGAQADVDRLSTARVQSVMADSARALLNRVAGVGPVNLLSEVIEPWATNIILTLGLADWALADPGLRDRLILINHGLFLKRDKDPGWWVRRVFGENLTTRWCKGRRKKAEACVERLTASGQITVTKPTYLGLTQTVPSFLARAWLALLQNPDQLAKLRSEPQLMACAVEELMRYAGAVHTLYRKATEDMALGGVTIAKDDFIILKIESANHDPLKFDSPDQLIVTRRPSGNLGLGTGAHACVGAALVRITTSLITPLFLAADPILDAGARMAWTGDSSVRWPLVVPATIQRQ